MEHGHSHDHSHGHNHDSDEDHPGHEHGAIEPSDLVRIALVGVASGVSGLHLIPPMQGYDAVALAATVLGGYPIYREALESVLARRMTMELSMTIALGAALAIGEFFTALMIVLFVLIAEVLEGMTVSRGRNAIHDLLDLLPQRAVIRRGEGTHEIDASQLQVGDLVVVKPGARLPVDGEVVAGNSFVDQATITGESIPVEMMPGSTVFAGTINQSGTLDVRTGRVGADTAFGKIVEAVERAEKSRAPMQKTADRLAGYLVYFALGFAGLTFLLTHNIRSTISVVIVAGACGIAAGTPLAILGAIGRAARLGVIIKGGLYLELLGIVDTIIFDKTGTLTRGDPQVTDLRPIESFSALALLEAAAAAERPSEHPLARAILAKAAQMGVAESKPDRFTYTPGRGVEAQLAGETVFVGSPAYLQQKGIALPPVTDEGHTEVWVAKSGVLLGSIRVADTLRPEAVQAVRELRKMGLRTVLLSGDAGSIAKAIGASLGMHEVEGELVPDQKASRVKALMDQGRIVAMIGDGVNDAPALTQANVGVALGSGTDVARESADIVLLGNDLLKLVETVRIARRCRRTIWQNFTGTIAVDSIGVALAAAGFLNPLLAAFIHVSSELVFILNSARLVPAPWKK